MVNALAPGLNTISLTSVAAESERLVRLELLKVAYIRRPIRYCRWRPVGDCIPVAAGRIEVPGRASGKRFGDAQKDEGGKEEHFHREIESKKWL
jgi:hypothetical protein